MESIINWINATAPHMRTIDLWVQGISLVGVFFISIMACRTLKELKSAVIEDAAFAMEPTYRVNKIACVLLLFWCVFFALSSVWKITMYLVPQQKKETQHEEMRCLQRVRQTDDDILVRSNSESNTVHGLLEEQGNRPECPPAPQGVVPRESEDVGRPSRNEIR